MKLLVVIFALLISACVSSEAKEQISRCENFDSVVKDTCLQKVAIKYKEVSACSKIRQGGVRTPCKVAVAVAMCDTSVCDAISEAWKRPSCIRKVETAVQCTNQ